MASHKIEGCCGKILVSFVEGGQIYHELIATTLQKTIQKHNVPVSVRVQQSPWSSWAVHRKPLRIRKIVLGNDAPFSEVIDKLITFYEEKGGRMIAAKMQLDSGRSETWSNPQLLKKFDEIEAARTKLDSVMNNGGKGTHFYTSALKMLQYELLMDFGETSQRLQTEFDNFHKPFSLA